MVEKVIVIAIICMPWGLFALLVYWRYFRGYDFEYEGQSANSEDGVSISGRVLTKGMAKRKIARLRERFPYMTRATITKIVRAK